MQSSSKTDQALARLRAYLTREALAGGAHVPSDPLAMVELAISSHRALQASARHGRAASQAFAEIRGELARENPRAAIPSDPRELVEVVLRGADLSGVPLQASGRKTG